MTIYHTFATRAVATIPQFNHSLDEAALVSLDSPASQAMHAFHIVPPQLIDVDTSVDEAIMVLDKTHNRTSFVVDKLNNMLGVISKARLKSSYVLKVAAKIGVNRKDLSVGDIMVKLDKLNSVSEFAIRSARVGDVLKTLESEGHEHLLVVNHTPERVVGYFDLIDMAHMIGRPLSQIKLAKSFGEIVDSLWHHNEI
ncbi:CBS domain-containing protein [Pseudoalteromonas fenneropenaei]|uniref:CBS domain-containing protein n=1 Tax=Pseudoalteromonas fenneropenaei TaxID=1737459 RepID=A0ABV7CGL6_9GAMM